MIEIIEWIIECLDIAEAFFARYRNTAYATGTLLALTGLSVTLYKLHIKKVLERGNLDLRQEFQAGYFDTQETRHDTMLNHYTNLSEKIHAMETRALNAEIKELKNNSIDAEICKKILRKNNVTIKD